MQFYPQGASKRPPTAAKAFVQSMNEMIDLLNSKVSYCIALYCMFQLCQILYNHVVVL